MVFGDQKPVNYISKKVKRTVIPDGILRKAAGAVSALFPPCDWHLAQAGDREDVGEQTTRTGFHRIANFTSYAPSSIFTSSCSAIARCNPEELPSTFP
jgi:hypothetical protein